MACHLLGYSCEKCFIYFCGNSVFLKEREEESKRLKLQKITEEAEQRRLANEYEQRKNHRILREIEERELEEAQALLQEAEKRGGKKKGKKPLIEGVSKRLVSSYIFSRAWEGKKLTITCI